MNYALYSELSQLSIHQATHIFDLARSAEKMLVLDYIGSENDAWKTGPYLSAPENQSGICHEYPYCLFVSKETQAAFNISTTGNYRTAPQPVDGAFPYALPNLPEKNGSHADVYVAKSVIIEQYELFKTYMRSSNAPFNERTVKASGNLFPEVWTKAILQLVRRRNELTHEVDAPRPDMKEAIEYYYLCLQIARWTNQNSSQLRPSE
ncbi:hypothetical protein [Robbsia andropogonis]|uniref:hypothetical protein n=1 Tax=Robbsia andropogonis TaxID=28092 RepID=UPI000463B629|nr:hypothetical protein [Robbsia andropogonis]